MNNGIVIVAGLGEIGRPLLAVLSQAYECAGIDIEPVEICMPCDVLHICYPFQIADFIGVTVGYIKKYNPRLTIINSTVGIGTTRRIQERAGISVVYSPVRGKHVRMEEHLRSYKKFVAGFDPQSAKAAAQHFERAGIDVLAFRTPEIGELSKLLETTWLGVLVGWAQDVERMAAEYGASYDEVNAFLIEIQYLPSHVFPGHIGGHCVMPNIEILRDRFRSRFLDAIVESNHATAARNHVPASRQKPNTLAPEVHDGAIAPR